MSLVILQKPAYGQACNRCGVCCERELCHIAMAKFRPGHDPWAPKAENWRGPCPALTRNDDGTTTCGLWDDVKLWVRTGGCFAND
jgi:hypothetical protein